MSSQKKLATARKYPSWAIVFTHLLQCHFIEFYSVNINDSGLHKLFCTLFCLHLIPCVAVFWNNHTYKSIAISSSNNLTHSSFFFSFWCTNSDVGVGYRGRYSPIEFLHCFFLVFKRRKEQCNYCDYFQAAAG